MLKYKKLSKFLKPLEIFGLQYFSLFDLSSKFTSTGYKIYFFIYTSTICFIVLTFRQSFFDLFRKVPLKENILGYSAEIFVNFFLFCQFLLFVSEAFFKVENNKNFFIIFYKFDKFLSLKMNTKLRLKFLNKIFKRRIILIAFLAIIFAIPEVGLVKNFGVDGFFVFFVVLIDFTTICLALYKICFYVDLLCFCLMKFNEILDQIVLFSHNRKLLLRKICQCKRCYVFVVEMTEEFNAFMSITLNIYIYMGILWLSIRFYYFLQLNIDDVSKAVGKFILLVFRACYRCVARGLRVDWDINPYILKKSGTIQIMKNFSNINFALNDENFIFLENIFALIVGNTMFVLMTICCQNIEKVVSFHSENVL